MRAKLGELFVDIKANLGPMLADLARARASMSRAGRIMSEGASGAEVSFKSLNSTLRTVGAQLSATTAMASALTSAFNRNTAAARANQSAVAGAGAAAAASGSSLKSMGVILGTLTVGAYAVTAAFNVASNGIKAMIVNGDRMRRIEGGFKAVAGSAQDAATAIDGVQKTAVATGVPIEAVARSTQRFIIALADMELPQEEINQFTDTLVKMSRIGGGTAQEISAGIQQLGQGLAKGRLDGDELRSVLENIPLIGRAIAEEMGVAVGELRDLGAEGKITGDIIVNAILKRAEETDKTFAEMPRTVELASGQMARAFEVFTAKLDESIGLSATLGAMIGAAADQLDRFTQMNFPSQQMAEGMTSLYQNSDDIAPNPGFMRRLFNELVGPDAENPGLFPETTQALRDISPNNRPPRRSREEINASIRRRRAEQLSQFAFENPELLPRVVPDIRDPRDPRSPTFQTLPVDPIYENAPTEVPRFISRRANSPFNIRDLQNEPAPRYEQFIRRDEEVILDPRDPRSPNFQVLPEFAPGQLAPEEFPFFDGRPNPLGRGVIDLRNEPGESVSRRGSGSRAPELSEEQRNALRAAEAIENLRASIAEMTLARERDLIMIGKTEEEQEKLLNQFEAEDLQRALLAEAVVAGEAVNQEYINTIMAEIDAMRQLADQADENAREYDELARRQQRLIDLHEELDDMLQDAAASFVDAAIRGGDFREVLADLANDILRMPELKDTLVDFLDTLINTGSASSAWDFALGRGGNMTEGYTRQTGGNSGLAGLIGWGLNLVGSAFSGPSLDWGDVDWSFDNIPSNPGDLTYDMSDAIVTGFDTGGIPPIGRSVLVGEDGPELVKFQSAAQVFDADTTQDMMSKPRSGGNTFILNPPPGDDMRRAKPQMESMAYRMAKEADRRR